MSTFRISKKTSNYTVLDNTCLRDSNLSWKAKGLLAYLLSLPDDWKINTMELTTHSKDGRDGTKSALRELELAKYIVVNQTKKAGGQFGENEYNVFETPQHEMESRPVTWKPALPKEKRQPPTTNGSADNGVSVNGSPVNGENVTTNILSIEKTKIVNTNETKVSSPIGEATEKAMLETEKETANNLLSFSLSDLSNELPSSIPAFPLQSSQGGAAASCKSNTMSVSQPAASKAPKARTEKQMAERTHLHQPFIDAFNTFMNEKNKDNSTWGGFRWSGIELKAIKALRIEIVKRANTHGTENNKEITDSICLKWFLEFIERAWANSDSFTHKKFTPDYIDRHFNEFTAKAVEAKKPQAKHQRQAIADFSLPENQFTSFT